MTATDVRPATKEQLQSLGGKFIAVEDEEFKAAETAGQSTMRPTGGGSHGGADAL